MYFNVVFLLLKNKFNYKSFSVTTSITEMSIFIQFKVKIVNFTLGKCPLILLVFVHTALEKKLLRRRTLLGRPTTMMASDMTLNETCHLEYLTNHSLASVRYNNEVISTSF